MSGTWTRHGRPGELAADLTVACDGRDSVVAREAGLLQNAFEVPMDVWQAKVPAPRGGVQEGRVFARFGGGQAAVTMDRGDYYQTSYLIPKGQDTALRTHDIQWLRDRLGQLFGWDAEVTAAIGSWDDVKLLDVTMGRLPRWYREGLLCIGDAAHTMSPVGGVGVNLAVQDAVAAARILATPLRQQAVTARELGRVQRRRELPVTVVQKQQRGEHDMLLKPALDGTLSDDRLPLPLRLVRRVPALRGLTAYLGGIGVRPERAPQFARRKASWAGRAAGAQRSTASSVKATSSSDAASRSSSGWTSQCAMTPSIAPPMASATVRVSNSRKPPAS